MKSTATITLAACAALALAAGTWWSQRKSSHHEGARPTTPAFAKARPATPPPLPTPPEDIIHPKVSILIGPEPVGYTARAAAVRDLPHDLSPLNLSLLMDFINGPKPAELQDRTWHGLVDSLINVLRRQTTAPEGLTDALTRLYQNGSDSVLKDYAVQYLRYWFVDREFRYKHEARPEKREQILATLVDAARKLHESYSGTALMAMNHITTAEALRAEPETQAMIQTQLKEFNALLLKAVSSPETNNLCRISAIQVAAKRGVAETLLIVRALAADPQANPNVRISAIAAIGQLGDFSTDKELLTRLEKSGQRFASAAKPALLKLSATP